MNREEVFIIKSTYSNLTDAIREGINKVSNLDAQAIDKIILIKPNICHEKIVNEAEITDIRVVETVLRELIRLNPDVSIKIIESDSEAKYLDVAFEKLGYINLAKRYSNVSLVNLSKEPTENIRLDGLYFDEIQVPKILLEEKFFISIAKAKTHSLVQVTGVLKNQFGCLPEKGKSRYHRHIEEVIVDVNRIIKPDLSIIDGIVAMGGSGKPKNIDLLFFGRDPVATDAALIQSMGFNPYKIKYLVLAEKEKLGTTDFKLTGLNKIDIVSKFESPKKIYIIINRLINKYMPKLASMIFKIHDRYLHNKPVRKQRDK